MTDIGTNDKVGVAAPIPPAVSLPSVHQPSRQPLDPAPRASARLIKAALVLTDVAAVSIGMLLAARLTANISGWSESQMIGHLRVGISSLPLWVAVFARHRLYSSRFVTRLFDELRRCVSAVFMGVCGLVLAGFVLGVEAPISRLFALLLFMTATLLVGVDRIIVRLVFRSRRRSGHWRRPVVIVGVNREADELHEMLTDPDLGYEVRGFVDPDTDGPANIRNGLPVYRGLDNTVAVMTELEAQGAVIAASAMQVDDNIKLLRRLSEAGLHAETTSALRDIVLDRLTVRPLGRFPVLHVAPVRRGGWRRHAKRAFDVTTASFILLMASPVLLVAALAVKLTSPGPMLFRQVRVGRDGVPFEVLKFRTMVENAEELLADLRDHNETDGPLFKMKQDPRVTRVGRIMRPLSIDELPQLWNVIRGEMSLVGPRPALYSEMEMWPGELHNRLRVRPGMTGLWQVHGRSESAFSEYERLDLFYVDNWNLIIDVGIILRTIPAVLLRKGAS